MIYTKFIMTSKCATYIKTYIYVFIANHVVVTMLHNCAAL